MKILKIIFLFTISCLLLTRPASAAVLFAGSAQQNVYVNDTFVVDWFLDTERLSLNTLDLTITFDKNILHVVEASPGTSLLSLWIKPPSFDNSTSKVQLIGGAPGGFIGSSIPIFRTTFKAIAAGNTEITMSTNSTVLKNDGLGSVGELKFKPLLFAVVDAPSSKTTISSRTHPNQNAWSSNKNVVIDFDARPEVAYSYSFSSNIEIIPDEIVDNKFSELHFDKLLDGIYYFKLISKISEGTWDETGVYRVKIDTTAPEEFFPEIGIDPANPGQQFLSFSAVDKTAGISHYIVKVGLFGRYKNATSPYKLQKPLLGSGIKVSAVDLAGNSREVKIDYSGYISVEVLAIILGGLLLAIGYLLTKKWIKKQNI